MWRCEVMEREHMEVVMVETEDVVVVVVMVAVVAVVSSVNNK